MIDLNNTILEHERTIRINDNYVVFEVGNEYKYKIAQLHTCLVTSIFRDSGKVVFNAILDDNESEVSLVLSDVQRLINRGDISLFEPITTPTNNAQGDGDLSNIILDYEVTVGNVVLKHGGYLVAKLHGDDIISYVELSRRSSDNKVLITLKILKSDSHLIGIVDSSQSTAQQLITGRYTAGRYTIDALRLLFTCAELSVHDDNPRGQVCLT